MRRRTGIRADGRTVLNQRETALRSWGQVEGQLGLEDAVQEIITGPWVICPSCLCPTLTDHLGACPDHRGTTDE